MGFAEPYGRGAYWAVYLGDLLSPSYRLSA